MKMNFFPPSTQSIPIVQRDFFLTFGSSTSKVLTNSFFDPGDNTHSSFAFSEIEIKAKLFLDKKTRV